MCLGPHCFSVRGMKGSVVCNHICHLEINAIGQISALPIFSALTCSRLEFFFAELNGGHIEFLRSLISLCRSNCRLHSQRAKYLISERTNPIQSFINTLTSKPLATRADDGHIFFRMSMPVRLSVWHMTGATIICPREVLMRHHCRRQYWPLPRYQTSEPTYPTRMTQSSYDLIHLKML